MKKTVDDLAQEYENNLSGDDPYCKHCVKENFKAGYQAGELSGIERFREAVIKVCESNEEKMYSVLNMMQKPILMGHFHKTDYAKRMMDLIKEEIQNLKIDVKEE